MLVVINKKEDAQRYMFLVKAIKQAKARIAAKHHWDDDGFSEFVLPQYENELEFFRYTFEVKEEK